MLHRVTLSSLNLANTTGPTMLELRRVSKVYGSGPSEVNALSTVWTLRADKLGTFTLGPSSILFGGERNGRPFGAADALTLQERGDGRCAGVERDLAVVLDPG